MRRAMRVAFICLSLFLVCGMAVSAAQVSLRVASWAVGEEDTFKNLAAAFTKLNPNITFTFEAKPFDQYFVLIDTQLQAGEAPDLFAGLGTASTVLAKWARAGSISPLDGIIDTSKFFPWLLRMDAWSYLVIVAVCVAALAVGHFLGPRDPHPLTRTSQGATEPWRLIPNTAALPESGGWTSCSMSPSTSRSSWGGPA